MYGYTSEEMKGHPMNSYVAKPVDLGGFMHAIQGLKDYWFEVVILPKGE